MGYYSIKRAIWDPILISERDSFEHGSFSYLVLLILGDPLLSLQNKKKCHPQMHIARVCLSNPRESMFEGTYSWVVVIIVASWYIPI